MFIPFSQIISKQTIYLLDTLRHIKGSRKKSAIEHLNSEVQIRHIYIGICMIIFRYVWNGLAVLIPLFSHLKFSKLTTKCSGNTIYWDKERLTTISKTIL